MSSLVFGITGAPAVAAASGHRTHMLYGGGFREDREDSYLRERSPLTVMTNFPESL